MKNLVLVISVFIFMSSPLYSQKVALVLSGGGAKGLAHIGVLKALEAHHIPIDCIAGTSMGGVVGGFYAAGYSPTQIEQMALAPEFQTWINGKVDQERRYFFSKKPVNPSWFSLDLRLDSSFNAFLTSNLANDLTLNFTLATRLAQASQRAGNNFDSLFVPFRTTGSEIFTQELVNFKSGRLSNALRVTMTVPMFYRPIKVRGRYLFDGGIYNNFPIDIAEKDFKPDVIIAVNVSDKNFSEYPAEQDEELITEALAYIIFGKADTTQGAGKIIYINPNMSNHSSLDFVGVKAIKDSGYVATQKVIHRIEKAIAKRESPETVEKRRQKWLSDTLSLTFNQLKLEGFRPPQRAYIRKFFDIERKQVSFSEVEKKYYRLVSDDYFKRVIADVNYNASDKTFDFELKAVPENSFRVNPGGLFGTRSSFIYLGFEYTYFDFLLTHFEAEAYTGGFYKSVQLRNRTFLPIKPQVYIEPVFTYNNWDFLDAEDFFVPNLQSTIIQQTDLKIGLSFGIPAGIRDKWELNGAYLWNSDKYSNTNDFKATDQLDQINFEGFRVGAAYNNNTLNRKQYPSDGSRFHISVDYIDGEETYTPGSTSQLTKIQHHHHQWFRFKAQAEQYLHSKPFSLGYTIEGVFSTQKFFTNYYGSLLYAQSANPLADSRTLFLQDFRANSYLLGGLTGIFHLGNYLEFRANAFGFLPLWKIVEASDQHAVYDRDQVNLSYAASGTLVFHSAVGPIGIRANYQTDPETPISIMAHVGFLLFNKRALE